MRRFALRGLRGRLLLALVATSAVTLLVVAAVTLSPLRERLREQSAQNLADTVTQQRGEIEAALARTRPPDVSVLGDPAFKLSQLSGDARILIANSSLTETIEPPTRSDGRLVPGVYRSPSFLYETTTGGSTQEAVLIATRALNRQTDIEDIQGDSVTLAALLYREGEVAGVLVAQRNLTEVATAVEQVRNALLVAALVGLAVAVVLGIAVSSGLTRRLARLRRAALRITAEGPDATPPRDDARDEVGDLARALARMQDELRRQEAARRAFVATASHELRTPLTMLSGTMELLEEDLREGADVEDALDQVERARRELRRLNALSGELLDLSRLDAAVQLRTEDVELFEIARAVAAEFALQATEHGVVIDTLSPARVCWGRGDPDAVARVVRILIDNALRYAPPDTKIVVTTQLSGNQARIDVADHGPGVPEEERALIFERFHRGRAASAESGFGLGLAIGRELAVRMNGTLELARPDGREPVGARFVLTLPASASSSAPSPAPGSAARA